MKIVYSTLQNKIEMKSGMFNSIVVENQNYYYQLIRDLKSQIDGKEGGWVLSKNDKILPINKNIELLVDFFDIDVNKKTLITKVISALEKTASDEKFIDRTLQLLSEIEKYVYELTEDYEISIDCDKVMVAQLLKALGITIHIDSDEITEILYTYMQLIERFVGERLFVFVNLKSYVSAEKFSMFVDTVTRHGFQTLFFDNKEYPVLDNERRLIIDDDLCEI